MTGDKNEDQVLNAIEAYTEHRQEITSRAINLLFDIARIERCDQLLRALKVRPLRPGGKQRAKGDPLHAEAPRVQVHLLLGIRAS